MKKSKLLRMEQELQDLGGEEIVKNIKEGNTEIEIAIAGRDVWNVKL
jgi:creatinase